MKKLILNVLIKSIDICSDLDLNINSDLLSLPNGYVAKILIKPKNISVIAIVENGRVAQIKESEHVDLTIEFKNDKIATAVLFGMKSIATAFTEHAIKVYGNINNAMIITRIINTVECYLFPSFITKKLFVPQPVLLNKKSKFYFRLITKRRS